MFTIYRTNAAEPESNLTETAFGSESALEILYRYVRKSIAGGPTATSIMANAQVAIEADPPRSFEAPVLDGWVVGITVGA